MKRRISASLFSLWVALASSTLCPAWGSQNTFVPDAVASSSAAVAAVYIYDSHDNLIGQGTGFFVSARGEMVTNLRALRGASKVVVKTSTGEVSTVVGVAAHNRQYELIKVLVDIRFPVSWLPLAEGPPEERQKVVVISAPNGAAGHLSQGWVSAVREVQRFGALARVTVPSSDLQSGSPIVDMEGRVVGVVSIIKEARDVYVAVPAPRIGEMENYNRPMSLERWLMWEPSAVGTISLSVDEVDRLFYDEDIRPVPTDPHEMLARGVEAYFSGSYEEAVVVIKQALELLPQNPDAHYTLGLAYESLGDWRGALRAFREAARLEPTYAPAYNSMGLAYLKTDDLDKAEEAFREAIRLRPHYAEAYLSLAMVYKRRGRSGDALSALMTAVRIRPDYAEAHYGLGVLFQEFGRSWDAVDAFETAVRYKSDLASVYTKLGAAYIGDGRPKEAVEALSEAIRRAPKDAEAHHYLGVAYGQAGRYDEELRSLEKSVELDPYYAEARTHLGVALWRGGRSREAMVEFKRALHLTPKDSAAHFYLGLIYISLGNEEGARTQYRVLAKLDGDKARKLFILMGTGSYQPTS